jgi:hypothetical protein
MGGIAAAIFSVVAAISIIFVPSNFSVFLDALPDSASQPKENPAVRAAIRYMTHRKSMPLRPATTNWSGDRFTREANPLGSIYHFPSALVDPVTVCGRRLAAAAVRYAAGTSRFIKTVLIVKVVAG